MTNYKKYWLCQAGGWSSFFLIYTFFYFTIRTQPSPNFFEVLAFSALFGLCLTHLMRYVIISFGFLQFDIPKQILCMLLITFLFSFVYSSIGILVVQQLNWESKMMTEYAYWNKVIREWLGDFLFILIWNFIYFTYHYIEKTSQEKFDRIKLESMVKELELKTIKSHINPHFIFNALNSIRALVDENPERARTAITELSNILRSSMQAEKLETAPLERELNIVRDYLELEHIRFEDRLRVEYNIDEDTLDQQVPPMMLQTLVENAIKHGISKQMNGGCIRIVSVFRDDFYELTVQNSGHLESATRNEGFGITSTLNRLKLLFGSKASFSISNMNGSNMVEAKVVMPVNYILTS